MSLRVAKHKKQSVSHFRARKQERALVKRLGGKLIPRSGAGVVKGDARVEKILRLECKTTKRDSFRVTRDMIRKIEAAALSSGEMPALVVEFIDKAGKPELECCVVPSYVLMGLISK